MGKVWSCWSVIIVNNGDEIIEADIYINFTTLSGEEIYCDGGHFIIAPPVISTRIKGIDIVDCHPINRILFTVIVEDVVVTKSGYEIGPFVFLLKS
jgi:hypothetical protein